MAYFLCFIFLVKRLPVLWKFSFSFSCVCLIWRLALLPKLSNKTFHSRFWFANTLLSLILDAAHALCAVGGRFMFKRSRVCSALDHGCGTSNRSKLYTSFDLALNCAVYSHRMPPHRLARNSQREREREEKTERERACFCLLTRQSWNLIDVMSWETFFFFCVFVPNDERRLSWPETAQTHGREPKSSSGQFVSTSSFQPDGHEKWIVKYSFQSPCRTQPAWIGWLIAPNASGRAKFVIHVLRNPVAWINPSAPADAKATAAAVCGITWPAGRADSDVRRSQLRIRVDHKICFTPRTWDWR